MLRRRVEYDSMITCCRDISTMLGHRGSNHSHNTVVTLNTIERRRNKVTITRNTVMTQYHVVITQ